MPGIDLAEFAERIRTLNAPEQGMNYRGAHSGERRYNEFDGKEYYTRGEPATLTVYGDRAQLLYDLIRNCAEIADALSTPVAQGDEVREAAQAVLDNADRQGSRMCFGGGPNGEDIWIDHMEVDVAVLDVLRATLTKGARDAG
jgi:hypothetical protein